VQLLFTLTAYLPSLGGAQLLMHQLARQLSQRHAVQVLTQWDTHRTDWLLGTTLHAPSEPRSYAVDDIPVRRITLPPEVRRRLRPWVWLYYPAQALALNRIAAALEAQMAPEAEAADLIHNCRLGREGLSYASLRAARARGIPFVFTPVHHPRWGTWLHRHYHRLYRAADAVIALTEAERRALARLGVDERRIHVTGMGPTLAEAADGERFREAHGIGQAPVVLFLGQKFAYKGAASLLAAAHSVWVRAPEARFVFIGPRTPHSRRLFARVTDRRIVELDSVDLQTKTDALAACTMLCVPSTQESFGAVYTEAWSLGKPVIAADIPATREVIAEGEDGYLAPPGPGPLAERITRLLLDPVEAARLGSNGRAKVAARYAWPRLAQLTEAVYSQVLGGRC
jgi:glycosyltransferase involved in cell wall biosynthesis